MTAPCATPSSTTAPNGSTSAASTSTPNPPIPTLRGCTGHRNEEKEMSRVELFERIRRDNRDQGLSIRALAAKHRVHRRAVREALASAVPADRRTPERVSPALGPWKP